VKTRQQEADELMRRIKDGPSLSKAGHDPYTPELAMRECQLWLSSWVAPSIVRLVPELSPKKSRIKRSGRAVRSVQEVKEDDLIRHVKVGDFVVLSLRNGHTIMGVLSRIPKDRNDSWTVIRNDGIAVSVTDFEVEWVAIQDRTKVVKQSPGRVET